jgi:hypothetical protein
VTYYSTYTFTVYGSPRVGTEQTTWGVVKNRYR